MSLRSRSAAAAFALVMIGAARTASADPPPPAPGAGYNPSMGSWLADPRISNGAGFKAGDFELHPSLGAEMGADSNWFMKTDKTGFVNSRGPGDPAATPVLRVTPAFALTTTSPQNRPGENVEPPKVNVQLSAALTYNEFFGVLNPEQRNVGANVNGRVDFLPGRPFSVGLFALYARTLNPTTTGVGDFNRNDVGGGLELVVQPGGGTLDWRLGYQVRAGLFDNTTISPFGNVQNEIYTKGRWKFRPRTALLYDANFRFMTYTQSNAYNWLLDGTPMRARLGMSGLVTSRIALLGMLGWASTFLNTSGIAQRAPGDNTPVAPPQWNSLIAQAEIKFFLTGNPEAGEAPASATFSTIALGYVRDYQTSFLSNFYGWDRGYLKWQLFVGPKAAISVEGGAGAAQYGDVYQRGNPNPIKAHFVTVKPDATVFGEYRILPSLAVNLSGRFTGEFSNETIPSSGGSIFAMDWKRFEVFGGVRWFM